MKKIGTITFHWATNYGAVLQAYALQQFLKNNGYNTEIINYVPRRIKRIQRLQNIKNFDLKSVRKEKKLKVFRGESLALSNKYSSERELIQCKDQYSAVICGSDQVWNMGFTLHGEGGPTLSYFLDFLDDQCKRIGYAVSFGTDSVSDEYRRAVSKSVQRFEAISVREESALPIVKSFGKEATLVCDPTVLLKKEDYIDLINKAQCSAKGQTVFPYILHKNQRTATNILVEVIKHFDINEDICEHDNGDGLVEWLLRLNSSEIVVTNSFHGVMLSIIFNTRFIAIPVEGSTMNNRITTILSAVGLGDRMISQFDSNAIKYLCNNHIDWQSVNERMDILRQKGGAFLLNNLEKDDGVRSDA